MTIEFLNLMDSMDLDPMGFSLEELDRFLHLGESSETLLDFLHREADVSSMHYSDVDPIISNVLKVNGYDLGSLASKKSCA